MTPFGASSPRRNCLDADRPGRGPVPALRPKSVPLAALADNHAFRWFWIGQTTSSLGDAFAFVAMPLLVFEATHSVVAMGTVTAVAAGGQFAGTTFAGFVVDRVHRRRLMILCDLVRMALFAILPAIVSAGVASLFSICALAAVVSIASNLFSVAYISAIPNLVDAEDVAPANGRLQATAAGTYVLGAALAGLVCNRFGPAWALAIDAVSFGASAFCLARIAFRADAAGAGEGGFLGGLRFLFGNPTLRALSLFLTGVALLGSVGVGASVIDLMIYRMKTGFGTSGSLVGGILALAASGSTAGALVASRTRKAGVSLGVIAIIGTALQGIGMVIAGLAPNLPVIALGAAFWSAGLTFRAVGAMSLRQLRTPDALIGRVSAAGWFLTFGGATLGAFATTRIAGHVGAPPTLLGIGVLLLVICGLASRSALVSDR